MKTKNSQEEIDSIITSCYNQGFSVMYSAKAAKVGYAYVSSKFYEWDVDKAKKMQLEKELSELFIPNKSLINKKSNFVLCTNDKKVLASYKKAFGEDYQP